MRGLVQKLERDPQVETILRGRGKELGLNPYRHQNEKVSQDLQNAPVDHGYDDGHDRSF